MIAKSKLNEIEKYWKKLENSESSFEIINLVKKVISLLDAEDYYEETADYLGTTTLKLRHLTALSLLEDKKFKFLLDLANKNLDLCFLFYRFPNDELIKFIKVNKRVSSIEKLVQLAAVRLDSLKADWKTELDNPWIAELQKLDSDVWKALADDSTMWIDFKKSNTNKIYRFSNNSKNKDWHWLYDLCRQKYIQGFIKEKNPKGKNIEHHIEIIKALSLN